MIYRIALNPNYFGTSTPTEVIYVSIITVLTITINFILASTIEKVELKR